MGDNYLHSELTAKIIKAFFIVYNRLGQGFLEKVYERALVIELRKMDINCTPQYPIKVYYDEFQIGFYSSDIFVEEKVIIEIKAAEGLREEHEAQLVNYLKATDIEVGLLLNFGRQPQYKRKVFSKEYKRIGKQ